MDHLLVKLSDFRDIESSLEQAHEDEDRDAIYCVGNRIVEIFSAGRVSRYHIHEVSHRQNVADHSFGVAAIIALIWPYASAELLKAGIFHDCAEKFTGDVPGPVKRKHPELKKYLDKAEHERMMDLGLHYESRLTPEDKKKLKCADYLEALLYCIHEDLAGNRHLNYAIDNCYNYIMEIGLPEVMTIANIYKLKHEAFMGRSK